MKFNEAYTQVVSGVFEPAMLLNVWPQLDKMIVIKSENSSDEDPSGISAGDLLLSYIVFTTHTLYKLGLVQFDDVVKNYQELVDRRKAEHIQRAHGGDASDCKDLANLDHAVENIPLTVLSSTCFEDFNELSNTIRDALLNSLDDMEVAVKKLR